MNARSLAAIAAAAYLAGCAQTAAPPTGHAGLAGLVTTHAAMPSTPALKFFDTPSAGAWPDYITPGPQHALWFSEFDTDRIGRITTDGKITEFPLPSDTDIEGIVAGPDGNIWFTGPGSERIGKMTPSGVVQTFSITGSNPSPRGIAVGPDKNLWAVEFYDSYVDRIMLDGKIRRFAIPGQAAYPWWIVAGPDGDLWFTESATDVIGRFNPKTLRFDKSLSVPTASSTPWGIMVGPDKRIWFTERNGNKLGVVVNGKIFEASIPDANSYPDTIVLGPDGDLWFTEMNDQAIGRIEPGTGRFDATIPLPQGEIPAGIAVGADRDIYFPLASYTNPSQIGEAVLRLPGPERPLF